MAKANPLPTTDIAGRVEVKIHAVPDSSPAQAEILLSGVRVGFVSLGKDHPVTFLDGQYLKNIGVDKLKVRDLKAMAVKAKEVAATLAKDLVDESVELSKLLAGETI